jgi:hypothetical protein
MMNHFIIVEYVNESSLLLKFGNKDTIKIGSKKAAKCRVSMEVYATASVNPKERNNRKRFVAVLNFLFLNIPNSQGK